MMNTRFLISFLGGWIFSQPLLGLSNDNIDSSIVVAPSNIVTTKKVVILGDSLRIEKLTEVNVEATLLRSTVWEKQPYRTTLKKIGTASGSETRTTPEWLMHQTGVMVQKTNHGGGSPTLRGLQGNQTLMLVDLSEKNVRDNRKSTSYLMDQSEGLDLSREDRANEQLMNEMLWKYVKGESSILPAPRRLAFLNHTDK